MLIVSKIKATASRLGVVVSAPLGVTNYLVAVAQNICDEDKLNNYLLDFKHCD